MLLVATYRTDAHGFECHLAESETAAIVHHIRYDGHALRDMCAFVRTVKEWAARHDHQIIAEQAGEPLRVEDTAANFRGGLCHE